MMKVIVSHLLVVALGLWVLRKLKALIRSSEAWGETCLMM